MFKVVPVRPDAAIESKALLLMIRPVLSPDDIALVDGYFSSEDFDWTAFAERALAHRLVPLLRWRMQELALQSFPEDIAAALRAYSQTVRRRSRMLLEELHAVATALDRAGIRMMTLKGPVFAAQAYADISLREFNDLDFMIDHDDYRATLACLQSLGFSHDEGRTHRKDSLAWRYYGQDILYRPEMDIAIEPHWRLLPSTFTAGPDFSDLWPNARKYTVEGYRFVSTSPEDTLLVLCAHHGKEHWSCLRQVCDVAFFLERNRMLDWDPILDRARRLGCRRAVLLGLYLCRKLMATGLPVPVVESIESDKATVRLGEEVVAGLLAGQQNFPGIDVITRIRFRLQDNLPRKLAYAARTVLMPSGRHFGMVYLDPPLEILYYPLKWGHDYLAFPAWKLYRRVIAPGVFAGHSKQHD